MKIFERFYKDEIKICEGHKNSYEENGESEFLGTLKCDVQPYESKLENKLYGNSHKRHFKIYCGKCDDLNVGNFVLYDGELYEIVSSKRWKIGTEVVIEGTPN